MTDDDATLWWGQPHDARRYHIFEGERPLATSLCGSWALGYDDRDPEVDPETDTFTDGSDCKRCARAAGVLTDDQEVSE